MLREYDLHLTAQFARECAACSPSAEDIPLGVKRLGEGILVAGRHEDALSVVIRCLPCGRTSASVFSWPGAELILEQETASHASHPRSVVFSSLTPEQLERVEMQNVFP